MNFSKFFIDRPIFAAVLSIVIFVAGLIAIPLLPISEYPEVVPPTVVVTATYPGANPKVIAETVSVAAGGADQRRRAHDVHEIGGRFRRRLADDDHVRARHGSQPGPGRRTEPRGPGAVTPAFGSGRARA